MSPHKRKPKRPRVECTCRRCGEIFIATPSRVKKGHGKYCSRTCQHPPLIKTCPVCFKSFRTPPSVDATFCSRECANRSPSKSATARKNALAQWNNPETRKRTLEGIKRRSDSPEWKAAAHFQRGAAHPHYKGPRTERDVQSSRYSYKIWRRAVLEHCLFTCQMCGQHGGKLTAHHIKSWAEYPALRYDVGNGSALCLDCHGKVHNRNFARKEQKKCASCNKPITGKGKTPYCRSCALRAAWKHKRDQSSTKNHTPT
jgi:hypothetical protein